MNWPENKGQDLERRIPRPGTQVDPNRPAIKLSLDFIAPELETNPERKAQLQGLPPAVVLGRGACQELRLLAAYVDQEDLAGSSIGPYSLWIASLVRRAASSIAERASRASAASSRPQ